MNKVLFLAGLTAFTLASCQPSENGTDAASGAQAFEQKEAGNEVSSAQEAAKPVQTPQDAQRISENTFNASPDPVSGESDYGLSSFKGACERAVVTAGWKERMEVALKGCNLVVDVRQYGRNIAWEVPLDQMDKGNMAPFLDDEYHPGFKLRSKDGKPVVRKTSEGEVENVSEVQLVFADKQNASQAIFSLIKMIDRCSDGIDGTAIMR